MKLKLRTMKRGIWLLIYIIILLFFDIVIFFKHRKLIYLFSIPVVFIIEHLAYTLGFWNGILKRNFSGYNKVNQGTQLSSESSKTKLSQRAYPKSL